MIGRSEVMVREAMRDVQGGNVQGGQEMSDLLARIESALQRAELAAERLRQRNRGLRNAARDTLTGLDRLIESERKRANG